MGVKFLRPPILGNLHMACGPMKPLHTISYGKVVKVIGSFSAPEMPLILAAVLYYTRDPGQTAGRQPILYRI